MFCLNYISLKMNRRELIKNIAAGTVTLFVLPAAITSCTKEEIVPDLNPNPGLDEITLDLTDNKYSNLLPDGGFLIEEDVIVINTGNGYIALSSICTHQGCRVSYDHDEGNLPCPCHGSVFSSAGSVLRGPANSPLKKFDVIQEGDLLTIVF